VLAEIIREMREDRGRLGGFDDSRLRERVEVLGPDVSLDVLRIAVNTALVNGLGVTWDERYGELMRFRDEHGHCEVPRQVTPAGTQLGVWCHNQRKRRYSMVPERRSRLDALGFIWNPQTAQWEEGFQHLRAFVQENGHSSVPKRHVCGDGYALGRWVEIQRQIQIHMLAERRSRLDALGFIWDSDDTRWEEGFNHLEAFFKQNGHCRVPNRYVAADGHRLGLWLQVQRRRSHPRRTKGAA
jgi:Helicase associated domain